MATVTRLPSLLIGLLFVLCFATAGRPPALAYPAHFPAAVENAPRVQTTLDFEDLLPSPDLIQNQYLGAYGVAFDAGKIIVPEAGTSSGHQALRASGFQAEFHEEPLIVTFTSPQSYVSMRVGLVQPTAGAVRVVLQGYNASGLPAGQADVATVGPGPTAINTELAIIAAAEIREVRLHYENTFLFEVIDDLTFDAAAPVSPETRAPIVQIWSPSNGETLFWSFFELAGTIEEESPLADVRLAISQPGVAPASFQIGVNGGPPVSNIYGLNSDASYGELAEGVNTITVIATDIHGNRGQDSVNVTYTPMAPPPPPSLDLYPTAIEVTQGIQDKVAHVVGAPSNAPIGYNGGVPLVAGKDTVVRLYGRAAHVGAPVVSVPAELWGYRNDTGAVLPGSPLQAANGAITLTPGATVDAQRAQVDGAWIFDLPHSWTQAGSLRLKALVNPGQIVAECESCYNTGNYLQLPYLAFNEMPMLHIYPFWACVRRSPSDPVNRCDMVNPFAPITLLNSHDSVFPVVLPVAEIDLHLPANPVIYIDGDFSLGGNMTSPRVSSLLGKVAYRRYADLVGGAYRCYDTLPGSGPACFTVAENHIYLGLMPPPVNAWAGLARVDQSAAVAVFAAEAVNDSSAIAAEEVSHAIDFNWHTPSEDCGQNPGSPNQNYPHYQRPDGTPYSRSSIGTWGFDPRPPYLPASLMDPETVHDYMSYCDPSWGSPYTYRLLYDVLRNGFTLGHDYVVNPYRAGPRSDAQYILVGGEIAAGDAVTLHPFYKFTLPAGGSTVAGSSPYLLQMRSAAGAVLAEHRLTVATALHGVDVEESAFFAGLFPYPPATVEMRIVRDGRMLAWRTLSAHAPSVTLITPAGGESWSDSGAGAIAWSGSDEDGDTLFYMVQYSLDNGATWQTLAEDLTATTLDVDLSHLAGAAAARVRVFATDGMQTTMAADTGAFAVANKAPLAAIVAPQDGATMRAGAIGAAQGVATDPEDGPLADEQLHWQLDNSMDLGTGRQIQLPHLNVGVHRLALHAEDSDGAAAEAAVTFTVTAPAFTAAFTELSVDPLCTAAASHLVRAGWQANGAGAYVERITIGSSNLEALVIEGPLPAVSTATIETDLTGGDSATIAIRAADGSGAVATSLQSVALAHCLTAGLTVDRSPLDFANVTVGSSHTATLILANVGTQAVTLNGLDEPAAPFGIVSAGAPHWPLVLAPGVSTSIGVRFAPQTIGQVSATVGVRLATTTVHIPLAGEGVAAPTPPASLYLPVIVR